MVLIGFEVEERVKKALVKKSKDCGLNLSTYLRNLIDQDLGISRDGGQYMTRREVEEMVDLKLKSIAEATSFNVAKETIKPEPTAEEPEFKEEKIATIKDELKEEPTAEDPDFKIITKEGLQHALLYLAQCFVWGKEPTSDEVYSTVAIKEKAEKDALGRLLKKRGIVLKGTSKNGEPVKIYRRASTKKAKAFLNADYRAALELCEKGLL